MGLEILSTAVFIGTALAVFAARPKERTGASPSVFAVQAVLLLLAAFSLRIYLGYSSEGFSVDLDTFKAWASALDQIGLGNIYYQEDFFLDYPPGYLYILLILEKLRQWFSLSQASVQFTLIIKMPAILCDLFLGAGLLYLGRKRLGETLALFTAALYLFCPVVLINSAQWGQVDSVSTALVFASVMLLYKEHYMASAVIYGLALACKPQALIFAPLYLFFTFRQTRLDQLILGVVSAIVTVLIVATPFTQGFNYLWLFEKYKATLDYYSYYSVNAYNFWTLIGYNWRGLPEGASLFLLNWGVPVLATLACGVFYFLAKHKSALFACPVILMSVVFLFGVKMHERYLYPAFFFILLCFVFLPDRRLPKVFLASSAAGYFNVAYVLYLFRSDGWNYDPNAPLPRWLSFAQLASLAWVLWVLADLFMRDHFKELAAGKARPAKPQPTDTKPWLRGDTAAVIAVTVIYTAAAFWNLGSTAFPKNLWTPAAGESVVFTADGEGDTLYYHTGLTADADHYAARLGANVQVEISGDGSSWSDAGNLYDSGHDVYAWYRCHLPEPARYVRLTALDDSVVLSEAGLKLAGQSAFAGLQVSPGGEPLTDEQDTIPLYADYKRSAYFDEIYHARTAEEHILGLEPYEYTHPPLGKYIIGLGIRLFGLSPFGWRFMGALFGVLMLPVLYHILKQLFGRTSLCAAGTLCFAFDFMHFTQTRIATIDTYAVFFLLLMYDAMLVFLKRDLLHDDMRKLLTPLLLCGIFTGLGIAAKWTAAYGALGLAVLFFGKLYLSFRDVGTGVKTRKTLWEKSLKLCGWCCLYFIAIPFAIYFTVFLPVTTLPQNAGNVWASFWRYQMNMYNYHSQLVAEHYFASPWYEWPLVQRPIWYYSADPANVRGQYGTISAMGSPLLWWAGFAALFYAVHAWLRERKLFAALLLCGFLSAYLPWVLVPRLTFIYHYFTAVPFLLIALAGVFHTFAESKPGRQSMTLGSVTVTLSDGVIWCFTALILISFLVFYPVLSGQPADRSYIDSLKLLPDWYF